MLFVSIEITLLNDSSRFTQHMILLKTGSNTFAKVTMPRFLYKHFEYVSVQYNVME